MFNDEEGKYIMDYEGQQMIECDTKNMVNKHVHIYDAITDISCAHQHIFMGVSGPADILGMSHVHSISTRTSFAAGDSTGHWHWVEIMTDRAVGMPDGTHTHYFTGRTSMNNDHCHNFSDVTNLAFDMFVEEEGFSAPPKQCKYKYKRPDDEEYN